MADNKNRSIFNALFRSSTVSTTNAPGDIKDKYNSDYDGPGLITSRDQANANRLVSSLRNEVSSNVDELYNEYDEMETEVIIGSALKMYSDDATTLDPMSKRSVWVTSPDSDLASELNDVMDNWDIDEKAWGAIYNIAKYGDYYYQNIFNDRGMLVGIKQVARPQDVLHISVDTKEAGYLVRRDPRLVHKNQSATTIGYDFYNELSYTHFYTSDSPRLQDIVVSLVDEDSQMVDKNLDVLRGRSIIEPVRMNYRILRLLEDTLVTNKIARSEYIRILNIEVGDADGRKTNRIINKVKNMFDAKPRYDGSSGDYGSDRVYKPSADVVVNSTHKGTNAIDLKEVGGNIETKDMADVDYFRNKLFAGLGIPKAFLGFEESLSGGISDGSGTLAKMDIRYSRSVRRVQKSYINGLNDLLAIYLISRNRISDANNFEVVMNNPSSADEIARLDEVGKRIALISQIMDSVGNVTQDTANLPELYLGLVESFVDDSNLYEIFQETLSRSIALKYVDISTQYSEARSGMVDSNTNLISKMNTIEDNYLSTSRVDSEYNPDDDDTYDPGGGGFSPGGGGFNSFDDPMMDDLDDGFSMDDDMDLENLLSEDEDTSIDDVDFEMDMDAESGPDESDLQSYNPIQRMGMTKVLEDLSSIANHGPTSKLRNASESLMVELSGGSNVDPSRITKLYKDLSKHYSNSSISNEELVRVNESLTSKDEVRRAQAIDKLLDKVR